MDFPYGCVQADLVYKVTPQRDLMLTFLPPTVKKYDVAPVYFIIPGGGWHSEARNDMISCSAISVENLRNEGFAVVSIDYRVCRQEVVMREIITDCFDAARYIAHFANILEIDKNKFAVSGHSAGAHLALMLAYAPQNIFEDDYEFNDRFTVKAVAAMSPPTILYDNSTHHLSDISDVFAECYTLDELKASSPVSYVSDNVPSTLLCAGTSDYLVFATSSERLYKMLKEESVDCELVLSIGGGHLFERIHKEIEPSISMEKIQAIITDFIVKRI